MGPMTNAVKFLHSKVALMNLHFRLAHISPECMAIIDPSFSQSDYNYIHSCAVRRARLRKRHFPSKPDCVKATTPGEVVSLDLPTMTKNTWDNKTYRLVLVDRQTELSLLSRTRSLRAVCPNVCGAVC